jgi:hypothetical protein
MSYESVLPEDFDGVFRFSNPSEEDFIGLWGGKGYLFPANSTTPIIIVEHSPLEIQSIRKKFAKDLAEREFYKSEKFEKMRGQEGAFGNKNFNSIHQAATYTLSDLEPYIQACLKPLKVSKLLSKKVETTPLEDILHRKDDGELATEAIAGGKEWKQQSKSVSLKKKALES